MTGESTLDAALFVFLTVLLLALIWEYLSPPPSH